MPAKRFIVHKIRWKWFEKTWREKVFLLVREVKIFGTKTKNFSRVFFRKIRTTIRTFLDRIVEIVAY
ncbi:hypothetical protein HR09_08410 [Porphyromonas gulae]|nr:hypothetical protein HR09_08410 [Porphyromonas gulae]